jgi:hypothetical protein
VPGDDDELGARGELRVVDDPHPGRGDVGDQRPRADDERHAALRALRELVLQRRTDREHLVERGPEAEPPQLADEVLGRVPGVVGHEDHALARRAQRRDRLGGALRGRVADPDTAIEVEQHVVV